MTHEEARTQPALQPAAFPAAAPTRDSAPRPIAARRGFRQRMFAVGFAGWVRLAALCLMVGVLFEASRVNPFAPDFTIAGMASALATGAASILSWTITHGWRPLLVGAIVVGPVWLLWRALWAVFRR